MTDNYMVRRAIPDLLDKNTTYLNTNEATAGRKRRYWIFCRTCMLSSLVTLKDNSIVFNPLW